MSKKIILIDYENVQKVDLSPMLNQDVLIKVFHGQEQKFTSEFTKTAIALGKEKIELIKISGNGKNALDFHIAYFMGKMAGEFKDVTFHVITKDTGFKPLVDYMNKQDKISCQMGELPQIQTKPTPIPSPVRTAPPNPADDRYKTVVEKLISSKQAKAKRKKTLRNQIVSIGGKEISVVEADKIIQRMAQDGIVKIDGEAVLYRNR